MINIKDISFSYGKKQVLNNFNLEIEKGECVAITGSSGVGKTTLLRIISGLEKAQKGEISIDNEIVDNDKIFISPKQRKVGLVFQDYALFPHLNVIKNVSYGCKNKELVTDIMEQLNIYELKNENVSNLSGGQQQRVAFARTLATVPKILLLDEPFSNLDSENKERSKQLIRDIIKQYELTTIIISHNKEDYEDIANRVVAL